MNLFIDVLLGENIHEEILKRALPIFKFYCIRKGGLENRIYDSMLKNWNDKHESISLKLEDIICEILPIISRNDKRYLFQKINEHKNNSITHEINLNFLHFLKKFTIKCLNNESNNSEMTQYNNINIMKKNNFDNPKDSLNYYGVDIFWELISDSNGKRLGNTSNINLILNSFIEILESTRDVALKENFLDKCFNNINQVTYLIYTNIFKSIERINHPKL